MAAIVNRVIAFTPEQDAALRRASAEEKISVSELVRRAVECFTADGLCRWCLLHPPEKIEQINE